MLGQPVCTASTLLCYARAVPLWIFALICLALVPLRAYLTQRKPPARSPSKNGVRLE